MRVYHIKQAAKYGGAACSSSEGEIERKKCDRSIPCPAKPTLQPSASPTWSPTHPPTHEKLTRHKLGKDGVKEEFFRAGIADENNDDRDHDDDFFRRKSKTDWNVADFDSWDHSRQYHAQAWMAQTERKRRGQLQTLDDADPAGQKADDDLV